MKKILLLLAIAFLLSACGDTEKSQPVNKNVEPDVKQEETDDPTQDELEAQLKADAIKIDFISVNGDEVAEGTKVTITGEVSSIQSEGVGGAFTITTQENDGFGMYTINNLSMKEVEEGNTVTAYGVYDGKDDSGVPSINVTVIE